MYYFLLLKPALWRCMGVNYNNKKQAKTRYSKIAGQHEKCHTQVYKNQRNDRKKIVLASQCGICINFDALELSGWFV